MIQFRIPLNKSLSLCLGSWLLMGVVQAEAQTASLQLKFPSSTERLPSGETAELINFKQPYLYRVAFAPDGQQLAVTFGFAPALLLETQTWEAKQLPSLYGIAFSSDGRWLATAEGSDGVRLWERDVPKVSTNYLDEQRGDVIHAVAFSPSGSWVATAHDNGVVRVWDCNTKQATATLEGHTQASRCLTFSTDGKILYTGSKDGTIRVWLTDSWVSQKVVRGPQGKEVAALAISSDSEMLAAVHGGVGVMMWNTERWIASVQAEYSQVAAAHGARLFALGGARGVLLTDGTRASERLVACGNTQRPSPVSGLCFSPDDTQLAVGNLLGELRLIKLK